MMAKPFPGGIAFQPDSVESRRGGRLAISKVPDVAIAVERQRQWNCRVPQPESVASPTSMSSQSIKSRKSEVQLIACRQDKLVVPGQNWQAIGMVRPFKSEIAGAEMGPSSSTPTSYDVALRAGVSQSTVSRCFRPGSSISLMTRDRVMAAARELGYQPNAMASGLITKRSNLVAVLISNLTNLYCPEVLAEITRRLSDRGIRVLLFALQAENDVDAMLDQIWRYRVDGAIVAARLSAAQLHQFARRRVPLVLYNRLGESEPVSSVCCDSISGERQLVDRLVAAGHSVFGIIAGPDDSYVSQERVLGAQQRLKELGRKAQVIDGSFDYESGDAGLVALMAMTMGKLDALICANDLTAIGAIDCARTKFGLTLPQDLSIVGFDGVAPAHWSSYRLSTVRQPVRWMSEAAVTMLMERIADPDLAPEVRTFTGALIEGASARL